MLRPAVAAWRQSEVTRREVETAGRRIALLCNADYIPGTMQENECYVKDFGQARTRTAWRGKGPTELGCSDDAEWTPSFPGAFGCSLDVVAPPWLWRTPAWQVVSCMEVQQAGWRGGSGASDGTTQWLTVPGLRFGGYRNLGQLWPARPRQFDLVIETGWQAAASYIH